MSSGSSSSSSSGERGVGVGVGGGGAGECEYVNVADADGAIIKREKYFKSLRYFSAENFFNGKYVSARLTTTKARCAFFLDNALTIKQ